VDKKSQIPIAQNNQAEWEIKPLFSSEMVIEEAIEVTIQTFVGIARGAMTPC
jgi:hypothetical protein